MVSTKARGDAFERQCQKKLESEGFVVMRSPRKFMMIAPGRFISKPNDFFSLFDICCKKDGKTRWIQCKYMENSHGNLLEVKTKLAEFHDKYMSPYETSEVWVWKDRKLVVYVYLGNYNWRVE